MPAREETSTAGIIVRRDETDRWRSPPLGGSSLVHRLALPTANHTTSGPIRLKRQQEATGDDIETCRTRPADDLPRLPPQLRPSRPTFGKVESRPVPAPCANQPSFLRRNPTTTSSAPATARMANAPSTIPGFTGGISAPRAVGSGPASSKLTHPSSRTVIFTDAEAGFPSASVAVTVRM